MPLPGKLWAMHSAGKQKIAMTQPVRISRSMLTVNQTPAHALTLTRAQRRGVPVIAQDHTARIKSASEPCGAQAALARFASMAGIMASACHRRKWRKASHHWTHSVKIANAISLNGDTPDMAIAQAKIAERETYRAANDSGESGGRARYRRRKHRPPPDA